MTYLKSSAIALALCIGFASCDNSSSSASGSDSAKMVTTDSMGMGKDSLGSAAKAAMAKKKRLKASMGEMAGSNGKKYTKNKEGIYDNAEVMPVFKGGSASIDNYINTNLNPSQSAIDNSREGTTRVMFVVDDKGKVTGAHTMGPKLGEGLDEEAVRVVSSMPEWEPAKINGKPVKVALTLPITFKPEEY